MLLTINIPTTVDVKYAKCLIYARYFEDSVYNGEDEQEDTPKIPFIGLNETRNRRFWSPLIDLEQGRILYWPKGNTAYVHYKSCDDNTIMLLDDKFNKVCEYEGDVPDLLDIYGDACGDYVIMSIDANGYIKDFECTKRKLMDIIQVSKF